MKKPLNLKLISTLAAALVALSTAGHGAAFTAGNLVVLRVGDGTRVLSGAAEAMFLDEYQPNGTFVQTVSLPTTNASPQLGVTLDGTQLAVGAVNRSADGQYLTLGGYNAAVTTAAVSGTTSAASPRVIVRVAADGTVDTSTAVTDGHSAGRFAGVATDDGTRFWTCGTGGATGGVRHMATFGSATTTTQVVSSPNNVLFPSIFSGQLYASLAFNPPPAGTGRGVCTIGTGLPTGTGQTVAILPGFPTSGSASPKSYHIADANTIYIADSNTFASGGGLQKWTFDGLTWSRCRGLPGFQHCRMRRTDGTHRDDQRPQRGHLCHHVGHHGGQCPGQVVQR